MKHFYKGLALLIVLLSTSFNANAQCTAGFSYTTSGNTATFTDTSSTTVGNIIGWTWDFGDGNFDNIQNPVHTYTIGGQYIVTLNIFTDAFCFDSFTDTVTVTGGCTASYTYSVDTTNGEVNFQAAPLSFDLSYSWDFGDSSTGTGAFPNHYYAPGTYTVCLMIADTAGYCSDTICDTITISGSCNASFTYAVDTTNGNVDFQAQPTGSNFSYVWDFGDSTTGTGASPAHSYTASGTYYVCLAVLDSAGFCNDTICDSVVVYIAPPTCPSSFTANDQGNGNIFFNAQPFSFGGTYDWDFGDGNLGQGFVTTHQYAAPGSYYVCLNYTNATGNCTSIFCDTVVVEADTTCGLTFNYFANDLDVNFFGNPFSFNNNAQYTWDFGDSNTGTGQNPTHSYGAEGSYYVCVTMVDNFNGCNETFCDTVTVVYSGIEEYASAINLNSYPNPFTSSTFIEYTLNQSMNVEVAVFDLLGNKVAMISNNVQAKGSHRIEWNAEGLSKGAYLLKISTPAGTAGRLLIKN